MFDEHAREPGRPGRADDEVKMSSRRIQALGAMALLGLAAMGCGGGNNLGTVEESGIGLEIPSDGRINLQLPSRANAPQEQTTKLRIRSTGRANLVITDVEWLAKPERLVLRKSDATVDDCSACANPDLCIQAAASNTCIEPGPPEVSELGPQEIYDFVFYIKAGSGELDCPDAPDSIDPAYVTSDYCGSLSISTNAPSNDGQLIEDGKLTVHFYTGGSSGEIKVEPDFLRFSPVVPGFSDSRTFSVENVGTSPLSVRSVTSDRPQFITISGNTSTEIAAGGSEQYTVQFTVPQNTDASVLDFSAEITVDSSAINASAGKILVQSDPSADDRPVIAVDASTLSFDAQTEQTLTVSNVGGATLQVTDIRFDPSSASEFYTITESGSPLQTPVNILKPGQGADGSDKKELTIAFARPAGNPDGSSVATLIIQHNDFESGPQRIVLLGDEGSVPLGIIQPSAFSFTSQGEASQSREFAIANRGTAPLEITDVTIADIGGGSGNEFEVTLPSTPLTVAPGQVAQAKLSYRVTDAMPDNVDISFTSNFDGDEFSLFASTLDIADAPSATITKSFATDAKVGQLTTFSADGSMPAGNLSGAQWYLLRKPAGSNLFVARVGESVSLVPDVAGDYTIALQVSGDIADAQEILEFTAVP